MKRVFKALLVLVIFSCNVFADELSNISIIERDLFGVEYNDEDSLKRLNRIEEHLFGEKKSGTVSKRLDYISEVSGISFVPQKTDEEKRIAAADYEKEDTSVNYPVIDLMENKVFNKNYHGENVYKRLARLEEKTFGKASQGDLSERTDKLKAQLLAIKQDDRIVYDDNNRSSSSPKRTAEMFRNTSRYNNSAIYDPNSGMNGANSGKYNYQSQQEFYPQNSYSGGYGYPTGAAASAYGSDFSYALSAAENFILGKSYDNRSEEERLEKLENKIFKKTFNGDKISRLERVVSAASAQKSGNMYKENKWERYLSTGIQVGSILLMVLAMIL